MRLPARVSVCCFFKCTFCISMFFPPKITHSVYTRLFFLQFCLLTPVFFCWKPVMAQNKPLFLVCSLFSQWSAQQRCTAVSRVVRVEPRGQHHNSSAVWGAPPQSAAWLVINRFRATASLLLTMCGWGFPPGGPPLAGKRLLNCAGPSVVWLNPDLLSWWYNLNEKKIIV